MQPNDATAEEATDGRTASQNTLAAVTGNPHMTDYALLGTDADGCDHYYSELSNSIRVVEEGRVVWRENLAAHTDGLDGWVEHIRDTRGWASFDHSGPAAEIAVETAAGDSDDPDADGSAPVLMTDGGQVEAEPVAVVCTMCGTDYELTPEAGNDCPECGRQEWATTPTLHVGDHVTDQNDDADRTMIVTGLPLQRAATYDIGDGQTVADVNPDYPATDHVVEVAYPQRTDVFLDELRTYAFPHSRLELVSPVHDRDDEQEGDD